MLWLIDGLICYHLRTKSFVYGRDGGDDKRSSPMSVSQSNGSRIKTDARQGYRRQLQHLTSDNLFFQSIDHQTDREKAKATTYLERT